MCPTLIHAPSSTAPHGLSHPTVCLALLPSTPPKPPRLACSLTCPWCSPSCSCTRNRGAGHGSSVFRCSRGAHLHTRSQGDRTGRPRRPQVAHMSALARGYRASPWRPLNHSPSHPGPCSPLPLSATCESPQQPSTFSEPTPRQNADRSQPHSPHPKTRLTIAGAAESTLQAAATPILAPPGTPATVGPPQAQGALCCLSTAQGAALGSSEQPPAASSHTSQGQVGGAQTLQGRGNGRERRSNKHLLGIFLDCTLFSEISPLLATTGWTKMDISWGHHILPPRHL